MKRALLASAVVVVLAGVPTAGAGNSGGSNSVAAPDSFGIEDLVSPAELEDIAAVADRLGMTLEAAVERYGWNDNFASAVAHMREAWPADFSGAEIVDASNAWVAFAGKVPDEVSGVVEAELGTHPNIEIELRSGTGFSEPELEAAIAAVHYAMVALPEVRDAFTSFDFADRRISAVVIGAHSSSVDELSERAVDAIANAGVADILNSITISVTRSGLPALGGTDSNTEHLGGEALGGCTSGFVVRTAVGIRGIATAGHCSNTLSDDGAALTFQAQHIGAHGDLQWHTGPQPRPDDFYAGNANATEVNRRDVIAVGAPVVGQLLCKNGITNHQDCQDVRKINVCKGSTCALVQMEARLAAPGDSGGSVYLGNTAYGLHQGWVYDPVWPFDRDLFSRADRLPNAFGVNVATN